MRRLLPFCLLLIASSSLAVQTRDFRGPRIGVLTGPERRAGGAERSMNQIMPSYLCNELRKLGYEARVERRSSDELLREGTTTTDDLLIEFAAVDANGRQAVGIGSGGRVGNVGVGGEVSIVVAHLIGELRLIDAKTLEVARTFPLEAHTTSPALTSIGLGGRYGYVYVPIPFYRGYLLRFAGMQLARDAAVALAAGLER